MEQLQVTSIEDLKKIGQGQTIQLSPFFPDGEPFIARLKRPNILNLLSKGKIPNKLVHAVDSLIFKGKDDHADKKESSKEEQVKEIAEMSELLTLIAKDALLEPTLQQLQEVGLELTDSQTMEIFKFTQEGVKTLEPFRKDDEGSTDN
ncbi:esterase [Clostridium botulinum]|uniref:esterase n=1 Tax=Clostridium botulinum TaxID=1491 RepID=UPI001E4B3E95|nr:esterase [Clostridium botulinum]MCD3254338.1 esterase [Clostridium botulinum C/D]MCD3279838.1 esterase [Clostridium botulinum C/D]MCD3339617.1 esterase [Clostridium botulinum C/D]MCD3357477.1 esterase [Clostridium botulinum C/D]